MLLNNTNYSHFNANNKSTIIHSLIISKMLNLLIGNNVHGDNQRPEFQYLSTNDFLMFYV